MHNREISLAQYVITKREALGLSQEDLANKSFITLEQAKTISYALTDKALSNPIKMEGSLRANILKSFLINVMRGKENE